MTDPHTKLVQTAIGDDPAFGSVPPPLYLSSTYLWDSPDAKGPYDYGRSNNPNRDHLAQAINGLEGGVGAVCTSSGMSALDLAFELVKVGELIIAPHDLYGGTHRLLAHRAAQGRFEVVFVDQSDHAAIDAALSRGPKLVLIETPSNPLLRVVDIQKITNAARAAGALSLVDNTFLSPLRQQPLGLGADLIVHSTTKYLNGHSDIIGGAIIAKDKDVLEQLAFWANAAGVTASAFDSYMVLRGMRTLALRVDRAEDNALALAKFLAKQKSVKAVHYPGLKTHPDYKLAKAQQSGPGAMLSFELGSGAEASTFCQSLSVFKLAASLGGVESLICQPSTMTHRGMSAEARAEAGITDSLLRLSVGIEAIADLKADLEAGFFKIG